MPDDRPPQRRVLRPTGTRRAEIVAAALAILREQGSGGLTARAVAARAGLALGQVSYHVASMEELLVETYRAASAELAAITGAALAEPGLGPMERLDAFLRAGFAPAVLHSDYLNPRLELWASARHHPALAACERELYDVYRTQLESLLVPLGVQDVRPVSDAIMALLDGLWLEWLRRGNPAAVEHGLAACRQLACNAARPGVSPAPPMG